MNTLKFIMVTLALLLVKSAFGSNWQNISTGTANGGASGQNWTVEVQNDQDSPTLYRFKVTEAGHVASGYNLTQLFAYMNGDSFLSWGDYGPGPTIWYTGASPFANGTVFRFDAIIEVPGSGWDPPTQTVVHALTWTVGETVTHVTITIPPNHTDVPVTYQLLDGSGNPIGSPITQAPGAGGIIQTVATTGTSGPLHVDATVNGVQQDGAGVWQEASGASVTTTVQGGITPSNGESGGDAVPIPAPPAPAPKPDPSDTSVWKDNTPQTPGAQTNLLTIPVYQQGVDKQSAYLKNIEKNTKATADALANPASNPTETRVTAEKATAQTAKDGAIAAANAAADSAKSTLDSNLPTTLGKPTGGSTPSAGSVFALTVPMYGSVNLDPANNSLVTTAAGWVKAFVAMLISILFTVWLWKDLSQMVDVVVQAPQAKGNTVAGSGGQITSAFAAAAITTVLVAAPTAYFAYAESNVGTILFGITGGVGANWQNNLPTSTIGSAALYLLYFFFPIETAISALTSYIIIVRFRVIIVNGLTTAIRWLGVPAIAFLLLGHPTESNASVTYSNSLPGTITITKPDTTTVDQATGFASYDYQSGFWKITTAPSAAANVQIVFASDASHSMWFRFWQDVTSGPSWAVTIPPHSVTTFQVPQSDYFYSLIDQATGESIDNGVWDLSTKGTGSIYVATNTSPPQLSSMAMTFGGGGSVSTQNYLLDHASITVDVHGVTVEYPFETWWEYFMKGFTIGCLWELGGLALRMLKRTGGTMEGSP